VPSTPITTSRPSSPGTAQPGDLAGRPRLDRGYRRGWLLNVGGLYAASEAALRNRTIAANLGHGYHHATADRGMGFSTIKGLVVVAKKLLREGQAQR